MNAATKRIAVEAMRAEKTGFGIENRGPILALLRDKGIRLGRNNSHLRRPEDQPSLASPAAVLVKVECDRAERLINDMFGISHEEGGAPAVDAAPAQKAEACFAGLRVPGHAGQAGETGDADDSIESLHKDDEAGEKAPHPPLSREGYERVISPCQTGASRAGAIGQADSTSKPTGENEDSIPAEESFAGPDKRWAAAAVRRKVPRMPLLAKSARQAQRHRETEGLLLECGDNPFADTS